MNIGNLFSNAELQPRERYVAIPVVVWDAIAETATVPRNYFSDLIASILSTGDRTIRELHELTNLDEDLVKHILECDLRDAVSKGIDRWHLNKSRPVREPAVVKTGLVVFQSMLSGRLIPHPVRRNDSAVVNYDRKENGFPRIHGGTKGKPINLDPYVVKPADGEVPDVFPADIDAMWDEYETADSELAVSDFDGVRSEYIERPENVVSLSKRPADEKDTVDFLLVRIEKLDEELFRCFDPLQPTDRVPMEFLVEELKLRMETDEGLRGALGLSLPPILPDLKDEVKGKYPNFPERVIDEICRFLALKQKADEGENRPWDRLDDAVLGRFQTMYECMLKGKDVLPLSDVMHNHLEEVVSKRSCEKALSVLVSGLVRKNLQMDTETSKLLTRVRVWNEAETPNASLKSLILRHLLAYFRPTDASVWFIDSLVKNGTFAETLKFIVDMAQKRNTYAHNTADRERVDFDEIFGKAEEQLKLFNEVYGA